MVAPQILLSIIFLVFFLRKWGSKKRPPPSPFRLPIIGHSHLIVGSHAHRSLRSLSKRYGELMLLHIGNKPVLVASSAEAAREIMKSQDVIFANRPSLSIPERLFYGCKDVAFARYGEHWRRARSMCVLQLLTNKKVQSFRQILEEETSLMVERIKQLGGSAQSVVNLSQVLMQLTNDIVCRAALGRKYGAGDGYKDFNPILNRYLALLGSFNVGDYMPWLAWINRVKGVDAEVEEVAGLMDEFLEGVLQESREKEVVKTDDDDSVTNFVETLLEFQKESKDKVQVEDDVIKAIILDIFGAAIDTTFAALEWAISELIRNPRVMKLLQKEVREVAKNKDKINEDDLNNMPYLRAVAKETLRLHPPFPLEFPRELTQDTKVLGYDVPCSAIVYVNCWAIARDSSSWKNPDEFLPERFFHTSIDYRGSHFEFLPFGAARRGCPCITFAVPVFELALSNLVNEFDFKLANGGRGEDLDMTESNGLILHKKSPLTVLATCHVS